MKDRDKLKRQEMIRLIENPDHLNYVKKIAWHYYNKVPYEKRGLVKVDDLISAGYEGLAVAAGKYDPETGVKFTTYSTKRIKGEIIKEMIFYIGRDALLIDDIAEQMQVSVGIDVEDAVTDGIDISEIPEKEQVKIIKHKLNEYKLTKDEITVYLAVNGIGCSKVTNLRALAGRMKKREMEIRRIKQSAESKLKKSLH